MNDIVKVDNNGWYQILVEEIQAIIVERLYRSRQEVISCWHEVGARICTDPNYQKYSKGNLSAHRQLAADIGKSLSSLYFAMQFYQKFPILSTLLESSPHGKNLSWHKIINEELVEPKSPTEPEVITAEEKPVIDFTPYHDLFQGCMTAYNHYAIRPPWLEHMGAALYQMDDSPFDGCQSFVSALRELVTALEKMLYKK
jgi:hypothetical protein